MSSGHQCSSKLLVCLADAFSSRTPGGCDVELQQQPCDWCSSVRRLMGPSVGLQRCHPVRVSEMLIDRQGSNRQRRAMTASSAEFPVLVAAAKGRARPLALTGLASFEDGLPRDSG